MSLGESLDKRIAEAKEGGFQKLLFLFLRLNLNVIQHLIRDQAFRNATSLAYTSILSMVPLLTVSFAVIKAFLGSQEMADSVRQWMLGTLLTDSVSQVTEIIESLLERAQSGTVGLVGFIFLLGSSISLYLSVERSINQIWGVRPNRPLYRRLTTFYAVITLSPAMVGLGFITARWLQSGLADLPWGLSLSATMISWVMEALALAMMYKLLPHCPVKKRAALVGGILAAIALELLKWGFNLYISSIYQGSTQAKIYGSFALIPVFFLWIYLVWLVILAGVELSYLVQNHRSFLQKRATVSAQALPSGYLLSRIFFEISRRFQRQGGATQGQEIATQLQIPMNEVQPALKLLLRAQLLLPVEGERSGYLPSRPLKQIKLGQLYHACQKGYLPGDLPESPELSRLEAHLEEGLRLNKAHLELPITDLLEPLDTENSLD